MNPVSPEMHIAELFQSKAETEELLKTVGASLEQMLITGAVCISKLSADGRTFIAEYASTKRPQLKIISEGEISLTAGPVAFSHLQRKDLLVPRASEDAATGDVLPVLRIAGMSSYIVRRIKLSHEESWGCIGVYFSFPDGEAEGADSIGLLQQSEVWIHLAATILERRLLEQSLRVFEIRSELAEKAGAVGIFDWEMPSGALYWSPSLKELFGFSDGEFHGTYDDWRRRVAPDDCVVIEAALSDALARRDKFFRSKYQFTRADGAIRWLESFSEILYDSEGKPVRMIGTARDATDEVVAREQAFHARRRLELALEAGELGFWDWNILTGEVQFGGQWGKMLGYSLNELEPHVRSWERLVHPDDLGAVMEVLTKHLEGKTPFYESEHRLKTKDGTWVWILDRGRVVERDESGKPLRAIGIHSNITQQRAVRDMLREADRRKDEFLATLAHELRNPLAPIRTGLAIIKKDPSGSTAAKAREMMERQLVHMVRLIDDLLDVSRITTGRLTLRKESVTVQSIIELAVEASRPLIDAGRHTLSVSVHNGGSKIYGDPTRLAQIVSNILTNAAKYTPEGGHIDLFAARDDGRIEITVTDNGVGIPKEMLGKVFELFGQVNRTLDRSQGGLGIGLALVKSLVAIHGGDVSVSSEGDGKGSTFVVRLPVEGVEPSHEVQKREQRNGHMKRHKRVLIVDDNKDGAEALAMYTQLLGHATSVAYNGAEALEQVSSFKPDVVFLDIGLPGMSGFEVAHLMRGMPEAVALKLVAVTGWGSEETKKKAREAGFDEHLTKPVDLSRVESVLEQ